MLPVIEGDAPVLNVGVADAVTVEVTVCVVEDETVGVIVGVMVAVGVADGVGVFDGVLVAEPVCVRVDVGVDVRVGVCDGTIGATSTA